MASYVNESVFTEKCIIERNEHDKRRGKHSTCRTSNVVYIYLQDLAVVYQKALPSRERASSECLEFCLADIQALIEGFVNACCFHLWVGLL
jgi:hypothetical protein